ACSRSSAISSTLPSTGFSCLRWFLRSALSFCLCCRVCSFWRLVNVDRPLGIPIPHFLFAARRARPATSPGIFGVRKLPARFARLPWMTAIIVSSSTASTTKTLASAPRTFRLRFGLVDGQRSSAQIGAVESRNRLVGFTGVGHFNEPETTGAARIPIRHEGDLLDRAVCLEGVSQLCFGCAVGQIPNVKVFH